MKNIDTIILLGDMPRTLKSYLSSSPANIITIGHSESYDHQIQKYSKAELYEQEYDILKHENVGNDVLMIISLEDITNATLSLLEEIKEKNIHVMYIYPFMHFPSQKDKMLHRIFSGVFQQYARSGLFQSFTFISEEKLFNVIPNITLLNKKQKISEFISNFIINLSYFLNTEVLFGTEPTFTDYYRVQTFGLYDMQAKKEQHFDNMESQEKHILFIFPQTDLESDPGILPNTLTSLPSNSQQNLTFSIHSSPHPQQFCPMILRTSEKFEKIS